MNLVTRNNKGSALTHEEMDNNFIISHESFKYLLTHVSSSTFDMLASSGFEIIDFSELSEDDVIYIDLAVSAPGGSFSMYQFLLYHLGSSWTTIFFKRSGSDIGTLNIDSINKKLSIGLSSNDYNCSLSVYKTNYGI